MLSGILKMDYLFCGWNINIDAVVKISSQQIFDRFIDILEKENQTIIEQFISAFQSGDSQEILVQPQVIKLLIDSLDSNFLLAGQGGFSLINVINSFPDIKPVLHLPNRCSRLVQMLQDLSPRILVFEKGDLQSIGSIQSDSNALPPIHIVMEYDSNFSVVYKGQTYLSKRNNRFIITFDQTNCYLQLDQQFLESYEQNINQRWGVFLSGYQLLSKEVLTDKFQKDHLHVVQQLKKLAKWVHLELAFTDCQECRDFINNKLLMNVSSVGLNEIEIKMQAQMLNITYLDEYQIIHDFFQKIDTKIMLYHNFGFYYALEKYQSGLNYQNGFQTAESVILSQRMCKNSKQFYNKPSFLEKIDPKFCYTPLCINPIKYSVGLGDTISSCIFIGMLE